MRIEKLNYQDLLQGGDSAFDFQNKLFDNFSDIGFVVLENHTICEELQKQFFDACKKVFELNSEIKKGYQIQGFKGQRGYVGFGQEIAQNAKAHDLKEFWHIGRDPDVNNFRTLEYL